MNLFAVARIAALLLLLFGLPNLAAADGPSPQRRLTVWLFPTEPAASDLSGSVQEQIDIFNEQFGQQRPVTVLNTTHPTLREALPVLDREYVVPRWPLIAGQQQTLAALSRFAKKHGVHLDVLFLSWRDAFEQLNGARNEGKSWDAGSLLLREGDSQYSSMALLPDGRIGVLYDCWQNRNYQLYFTTFSLDKIR